MYLVNAPPTLRGTSCIATPGVRSGDYSISALVDCSPPLCQAKRQATQCHCNHKASNDSSHHNCCHLLALALLQLLIVRLHELMIPGQASLQPDSEAIIVRHDET